MSELYRVFRGIYFLSFLFLLVALAVSNHANAQDLDPALRGKIVSSEIGLPIYDAKVTITSLDDSLSSEFTLRSNREGEFELKQRLQFPLKIIVTHNKYGRRELEIENSSGTGLVIELTRLPEDVAIKGRVVKSQEGTGVESATISLISVNGSPLSIKKTNTDASGRFNLSVNVNPDITNEVTLSVSHPDYLTFKSKVVLEPGKEYVLEAQPQSHYIRLAGKVTDKIENNPIEFVSIQVLPGDTNTTLEKAIGTTTDIDGNFEFTFRFSVPLRLKFSHISYKDEIISINDPTFKRLKVEMIPEAITGEEVYVISNIVSEDELKNTGTIDKISNLEIQEIASMSAFDLVSTMREVDVSTQSINLQSISTRGFNATANPRFLQLTDGIDNQAPGLGFPLGNLMGPSDLDIASIELLVGPSTSRYGSGAMSGVLLTHSKDPFVSEGFSFNGQLGTHDLKLGGADAWGVEGEGIYDIGLRYAKALGNKFAFKVTGTLTTGTDWVANNYDNLRPDDAWPDILVKDPGFNGVNLYGDESFSLLPVGVDDLGRTNYSFTRVSRTGYREENLVDYDIATRKLGTSLHYKFNERSRLELQGRYGYTNTLYTSDSRIRLEDFEMYQIKSELNINNFTIRGYTTSQFSGESYNVNILANELITSAKSNADWYRDFELVHENGRPIFGIPKEDVEQARRYADSGSTLLYNSTAESRFEPGTPEFKNEVDRLKNIAGFDEGAGIVDNSRLYHTDIQNTFENVFNTLDLTTGGSFRYYDLESSGTIFPDTTGNAISNYEYGLYLQMDKDFLDENLVATAALRLDKNENFDYKLSQEVGFNYNLREKHFFRLSFQNGFRYPTVREQFLNSSLGKGRLVGGLSQVNGTYELPRNSFTVQTVEEFNRAVTDDLLRLSGGYNRTQAELQNIGILERGIVQNDQLQSIQPEITQSIEAGYRQLVNERLYVDLNYFVSFYDQFIGIKRLVKPRTSPTTDLFTAAGQINRASENDRYFVYSNSEGNVTAQGVSFDIQYTSGNFISSLNGTWTRLFKTSDDPIIPGYNTPPLKINFEWGARELVTNVGFKMTFRARNGYDWQSSFLDGRIPAYGHFDFQFNIKFPGIHSRLKTGVTNIGVTPYYDTFGGPAVGSILFTSFSFSPGSF